MGQTNNTFQNLGGRKIGGGDMGSENVHRRLVHS